MFLRKSLANTFSPLPPTYPAYTMSKSEESKFSFFKSNKGDKPDGSLTLEQFIDGVKEGTWAKQIANLRLKRNNPIVYKGLKNKLPGVTISALLKNRDKKLPMEKRLLSHSGLIAIDIDKKDNPKLRASDQIDKEAVAEFISPGGEGKKLIYRCTTTNDVAEHRRIFDAAVQRLDKLGVNIKVDPIVKALGGLQYVSADPDAWYNPKTKLILKPLQPITRKKETVPTKDQTQILNELNEYIDAIGKKDITSEYEDWLNIMFGLAHSFGEAGRKPLHRICKNYKAYAKGECDEKYDACIESTNSASSQGQITISTVFQLLASAMPKAKARQFAKKYNRIHAVGKAEEITEGSPELVGLVKYKLFLFKPVQDPKTKEILDLQPTKLNLNAFEKLLQELGFYRYERMYVHIKDNIVDTVDVHDILHRVTQYVEQDGNYVFTYKEVTYEFSWEDIAHRWREIRALSTTATQITASLTHWLPNLLKDEATISYIPYQNGVVEVSAKAIRVKHYKELHAQVWKERILPRDFIYRKERGMFEDFFINVMGRGDKLEHRQKSENFRRAVWYYGYMLQGTKRQSTARAWILYDIKSGNNGRSGKTILGSAVGHIRSVAVIDGKRIDLNDRFAFQNVQPWNDIIFIDDPDKRTSLVPLFNMISGTTLADRKTIAPIVKDLKIMIASNWILESSGTSEAGRQFISQLDDFYVRYSKKHNNTIQPLVDCHGKEFFTDWDAKDWNLFDSFSLRCLQSHLSSRAPENTIIGNSSQIRFMQMYEEEMFYDLCVNLVQNSQPHSSGSGTVIVQGVLTAVVKEHAPELRKVGVVAKEFLKSLGCTEINNTTYKISGMPRMAWQFSNKLSSLNWGELKNKLPKIPIV